MRRGLVLVGVATLLNVAILGTASYHGVEYMDSARFCGVTCHSVMAPEYAAYVGSPHARVGCVECHIGPGAPWFVRTKYPETSGKQRALVLVAAREVSAIYQRNVFPNGEVHTRPVNKLSITFTGQKQKNDFAESVTGLLDQSFDSVGADVTYLPSERFNCSAGYVAERYFFLMAAAYIPRGLLPPFDPANLWENRTTDKVDTYRAGFNWAMKPEKWTLDVSLDYTKPRSESLYAFALPGTPIGGLNEANGVFPANVPPVPGFPVTTFDRFPLVSKNSTIAKIRLEYQVDKNLTASVMYWKQKFDNVDWQTNNTLPYMGHVDPGANRWLFLGAQVPSYDANIFRAAFSYRF